MAKDYAEQSAVKLCKLRNSALSGCADLFKNLLAALELAGLSAQRAIQYDRAMQHFREAEKLTDRDRHLNEWVTLQHEIADLLVAHGKYSDAERLFRGA